MRSGIRLAIAAGITALAASTGAFAQAPSTAGGGAQAAQLPLSGRGAQSGGASVTEQPIPGATTSVNTINPSVQVQGNYTGSTSGAGRPFSGKLSLREAVDRGLAFNLGPKGISFAMQQAHGQTRVSRSNLMPNLNSSLSETVVQNDLAAQGLRISAPIPGFRFPTVVGPFNYFDLRARLSQTIADFAALNNYRSTQETFHADEFLAKDARDLVVLAVGGAYLQAVAAKARVEAARSQVATANALYDQTNQQRQAGLVARIDADRSQVQALTQQQRMISLENDFAKQKINLARLTGLPPNSNYELSDDVPFSEAPPLGEEDAVRQAFGQRSDLKAAEAQIRAADRTRTAAKAERLPSLGFNADYGVIGTNPSQSHGTFSVVGTLRIPIWQGGRAEGDIEQANAVLDQRRAELEDLKSRVESDVRNAFLDLKAATSQVDLAQKNLGVTQEALTLTRQRFEAGITDSLEVSQAETTVASAQLDLINSVFAHNIAKLSLARAEGSAADSLARYLKVP
ncbi:MAG TPA: TolC family protein [Bryobacteraceae bacterium]|jgi:outer membrane protein TolC|nr:TolC family protein [Bryobacteraceae bacterium]